MNREEKLLREFVSFLVAEERGKSHVGAAGSDVGGAIKNVGGAATGLVKKLFSRTKTILRLSAELVKIALVPWAKSEYDKIMANGEKEIAALEKQYPSYSVWEFVPPDLRAVALFLNPTATIFAKGADIVTGGGKNSSRSGGGGGGYGVGMGPSDADYSVNSSYNRQGNVIFESSKQKKGQLIRTLKRIKEDTLNNLEALYQEVVEKEGEKSESAETLHKIYSSLSKNTIKNIKGGSKNKK